MGAVASKGGKRADKALWIDRSRDSGFWGTRRDESKQVSIKAAVYFTVNNETKTHI